MTVMSSGRPTLLEKDLQNVDTRKSSDRSKGSSVQFVRDLNPLHPLSTYSPPKRTIRFTTKGKRDYETLTESRGTRGLTTRTNFPRGRRSPKPWTPQLVENSTSHLLLVLVDNLIFLEFGQSSLRTISSGTL